MKRLTIALFVLTCTVTFAQSRCDRPSITVKNDEGQGSLNSFILTRTISINLQKASSCKSFENYGVVKANVTLSRGTVAVHTLQATSGRIDTSTLMELYKPGDRLLIEVTKFKAMSTTGTEKIFDGNTVVAISLK